MGARQDLLPRVRADPARVARDVDALRRLTDPGHPYTRRAFSERYAEGRRWLADAMREAGLDPALDAAGNLVGCRPGAPVGVPSVLLGSHIDTVPGGGAWDGVAGVAAALEVARLAAAADVALPFGLEVVDFLSEEPSDFGLSCIGSRGLAGKVTDADLDRRSPDGERLADALRRVGGDPDALGRPLRQLGTVRAFLELHIEQAPRLERAGVPLGVVSGIVGIRRYEARLRGAAAHAGSTGMPDRRDALAGAAEAVLEVERLARERAGESFFVATTGRIAVAPNAANVVAGSADLTVDLRALEEPALAAAEDALEHALRALAARRALELELVRLSAAEPVPMDARLRAVLFRVAARLGVEALELESGGGHDAAQMAAIGPAAMLFVPCVEGRSHVPEEEASPVDVALGADVLFGAVLELASDEGRA